MKKKIAIVGFGYVGQAMQQLFSHGEQFELVTYDKKMIKPYPHDYGVEIERAREPLRGSRLAIVCVPTPMRGDGAADISAVLEVASWINAYAELVLIKSTVPPGTVDDLNRAAASGCFHFSPEYAGEGKNYVAPWRHPDPRDSKTHDFVIVGGPHANLVLDFFARVMATDAKYIATSAMAAELAKYAENAFLATKLRFCFELAEIAGAHGVAWSELRELWLCDSRVGRSHTLVHRGQDYFSGKCLPKDLSALVHVAHEKGIAAELLSAVSAANEARRRHAEGK